MKYEERVKLGKEYGKQVNESKKGQNSQQVNWRREREERKKEKIEKKEEIESDRNTCRNEQLKGRSKEEVEREETKLRKKQVKE